MQAVLESLMHGRTAVVHCLSTIEKADRIEVLAKAAIFEIGGPAERLAKGETCARSYRSQFEAGG